MIEKTFAKGILNALFHTSGSSGVTPSEEWADLEAQGIKKDSGSFDMYKIAFYADGFEKGDNWNVLEEKKTLVNKSVWFYTVDLPYETYEYEVENDDGTTTKKTLSIRPWEIEQNLVERVWYKDTAYLALFTKMPDEHGNGYVEPITGASGDKTTYMRVNLKEGIITGGVSLNEAVKDEVTGEAKIDNCDIIVFPEVFALTWGTIVGFGVFNKEEAGTGDTPIFWGRLKNPVTANVNHVPLFRIGNFKVTMQ